jgi:hypothetical protein
VTQPGGSGNDLIGDFQRWLLRAGARGMSRELADQVRTALGKTPQPSGDVWETATHDPAPGEAPECAWCPLCRAARIVREAKPTRDNRVAAVGDALTTVVQDAVSVLEAALAATSRGGTAAGGSAADGRGAETRPGTRGFRAAGSADQPARAGQAAPKAPAGKAEPAGKAAPAGKAGKAAPETPAGKAGPGRNGQAAPAAAEQAAPEPPEESPHEPDDRG